MDSIKNIAMQAQEKGESVFQIVSEGYSDEHLEDVLRGIIVFALPHDQVKKIVLTVTPAHRLPVLEKIGKAVFTCAIPEGGRFRITVHEDESVIRV